MAKSVFRRFPSDDLEVEGPEWEAVNLDGQTLVRTAVGNAAHLVAAGFFEATGEGVTHQAAVAFAGAGSVGYAATVLRAASFSATGAGSATFSATVLRAAGVAFAGSATFSATASVLRSASATFVGSGSFVLSASVLRAASVEFTGRATVAVAASVVRAGHIAFTGAGAFALGPVLVHAASVTFAATSTFGGAATMLLSAAIAWAPSGLGTLALSGGTVISHRAGGSVGRDWQLFTKRGRQRQRGKRRQDEAPDNDDEMALIAHFAVRFLDE